MKLRTLHTAVCLLALIALLLAPLNAAADEPAPDGRSGLLAPSSFLPLIMRSGQPAAPVIHSFTANPATIVAGAASILSWQVTGATSLSITPGVGTVSGRDSGVRPALALDGAGNPRIAYDAEHRQGGACGTFTDTKLTRFIQFNQP